MILASFKNMVAGYLTRTVASFSDGTTDYLLQAMNDARRAAQRAHDFELNRTEDAYLTTTAAGANWLTGCKTTPGGATAVLMKRLDEVWNYNTTTINAASAYLRTSRIDFADTGGVKRGFPKVYGQDFAYTPVGNSSPVQAYANGPKLYLTGMTTSATVKLVGIKFLDDLADGDDPDIFLTYFTDWLKLATIGHLNVYLKDSERFPIDETLLAGLWQSVKTFDGTMANMGEAANLD